MFTCSTAGEEELYTLRENEARCPECNSSDLQREYERGEVICNGCGLVIDQNIIDHGAEWRAFDSEQMASRTRTGAPLTNLIHDQGLTTTIDWRNKDSSGRNVAPGQRAQLYRLRKWQQRIKMGNARERNLAMALIELNRVAGELELPKKIREAAAVVYRRAVDEGLVRGRSIEAEVHASLYIACRQCSVPRTLEEISQAGFTDRKEIAHAYKIITRALKMNLSPTSPADYLPRFCSSLGLGGKVECRAREILEEVMNMGAISGKSPIALAGAAIYIASVLEGDGKTQKEVGRVAGVTDVTLRNNYKWMARKLSIEMIW